MTICLKIMPKLITARKTSSSLKAGLIRLLITAVFFLGYWFYGIRSLLSGLFFVLQTGYMALLGILAGGLAYVLLAKKGQLILDNSEEFLAFCQRSNGLIFWGPYGAGKTALMAWLAHKLPEENKYASFPCTLPWVSRSQIDFSARPPQPLGIKEVIFIDEINLLFKGNEVYQARQRQKFMAHFYALSRHQGTKIFINGQRLGQVWIELREVATAICQVAKLAQNGSGLYVQVEIWQAAAWEQHKTNQQFVVFIPAAYLNTYNSTWLKALKYLRTKKL